MSEANIDSPQALDGAVALRAQSKQNALSRAARGEGVHMSDVLFGLVALSSTVTIFLDGESIGHFRPALYALIASVSISQLLAARATRQIKALHALLESARAAPSKVV